MRYINVLVAIFMMFGSASVHAKNDYGTGQKKAKKTVNEPAKEAEAAKEEAPEAKEFKNPQHAENMAYLEEKMSGSKMTDTQKAELADHFEKQFPEDTSFKSEEQKENAEFLGKLAGDPTMTMQEMKLAIRNLRDSQKKEFKTVPAEQEPTAKVKKENVKKEKEAAGDESK